MTSVATRFRGLLGIALVLVAAAAIVIGARTLPDRAEESSSTITDRPTTTTIGTTTTAAPSTTTTSLPPWPELTAGPPRAVVTPSGVVLAVLRENADGSFVARAPCGGEAVVRGTPLTDAHVVLDPGHGGEEPGAVGPAGTLEKAVNLAIAQEAKRQLEALGATVVLTRTADYRITLRVPRRDRHEPGAVVFVSIHHNADPDEHAFDARRRDLLPDRVARVQAGGGAGVRGAGRARSAATTSSGSPTGTPGAKFRPTTDGSDYYGILRRSAGVPAVLSEAAFISNPAEEALLADPAFQKVEATALTKAIVRFVTTDDPGSGYVDPYPRTQPAGPGGGHQGCEDPPLG